MNDALKQKIESLPDAPGVYIMKDAADKPLYVGKAKSLRSRVVSYFRAGGGHSPRTVSMADTVADIEIIETASEVDALLLESRLIKDLRPPNNVLARDDKSFPYLEITMHDDYPRVRVTRQPNRKSRLFGPFVDPLGLRAALKILQRIFRFRVCSLELSASDPATRRARPCLYHYIQCCTAPCADRVPYSDYRQQIRHLISFLGGKGKALIEKLEKRMLSAARSMRYEEAAQLRDQIEAIKSLAKRGLDPNLLLVDGLSVDPQEGLNELQELFGLDRMPRIVEGVDLATLQGSESVGSLVQFIDGRPFKNGYRRFKIRSVTGVDDYAMMREVVYRRYSKLATQEQLLPDALLLDGGPGQLAAAEGVLRELNVSIPLVVALAKKEETLHSGGRALKLKRTSPALKLLQYVRDEAHRFAQSYHHLLRGKSVFGEGYTRPRKKKAQPE